MKKETMNVVGVAVKSKFVTYNESLIDKTDKDVKIEKVIEFVEDAIPECELTIDTISSNIKTLNNKLVRAKRIVEKAIITRNNADFTINSNFSRYIEKINSAQSEVEYAESNVADIEEAINQERVNLIKYQKVLSNLTATV